MKCNFEEFEDKTNSIKEVKDKKFDQRIERYKIRSKALKIRNSNKGLKDKKFNQII